MGIIILKIINLKINIGEGGNQEILINEMYKKGEEEVLIHLDFFVSQTSINLIIKVIK